MMRWAGFIATFAVCASMLASPAAAQLGGMMSNRGGNEEDKEVTPPQQMVPLPEPAPATPPQPQQASIPPLPPSLTCKPEWLYGLWGLQHVYEAPPGSETQAYLLSPVQYISFSKDSRFARLNAGNAALPPEDALKQMYEHSGALLQFLLQTNGMLYLYRDRVATETLACFVVAEAKPPYAAGNLLLMPPKGTITGRLVKVYRKLWSPPKAPPGSGVQPQPRGMMPNQPLPQPRRPQSSQPAVVPGPFTSPNPGGR